MKKPNPNIKFVLSLCGFFVFLGAFWLFGNIFITRGSSQEKEIAFVVDSGQGLSEVATKLEQAELIHSKTAFVLWGLLFGKQGAVLTGEYQLSPEMSGLHILRRLTTPGQARKVVIFEGFALNDIALLLEKEGVFKKEDFLTLTNNASPVFNPDFPFLSASPEDNSLEGFLFPDSYEFSKLDSPQIVVNKMLRNFQEKIIKNKALDITDENGIIRNDFYDILIMASLIEKEVKTYQDKRIVSGVLWKRLKNSWPLQVDATLVYITDKNPVNSHKDIDSPYNTYKNKDLPPGPICNPGLNSIKAALNPIVSDYWYYLSAKNGQTIFSKTLQEHNINRGRYLK